MNKKISTDDAVIFAMAYYEHKNISCQNVFMFIFAMAYYEHKNILTRNEDWQLIKKYKNFKGLTCRDFCNEEQALKCIVIFDDKAGDLQLIENEDHQFFLKQAAISPVFYYVPTICNEGLVFYFEPVAHFDKYEKPISDTAKYKALLEKKLISVFKKEGLYSLSSGLFFAFPTKDMDEIITSLEENQLTFNLKLFDFLDDKLFQPIIPDITLAKYRFPEDEKLSHEQIIKVLLSITSKKKSFINEDYAHIRSLLKRISREEFPTIRKIVSGFKNAQDKKLLSLFESEDKRRKAQELVKKIWKTKKTLKNN